MKSTKKNNKTDFADESSPAEYFDTTGNKKLASSPIPAANREMVETILERMERYTHHLEGLIHRKYEEMHLFQRTMASRVEAEIQKSKVNERVMVHQARQAAMGELLGVVAHHWRQPLNVIALVVQNMKEAWDTGEFDSCLLDRTIFRAMEQINQLSRSIMGFGIGLYLSRIIIENNLSGSIWAINIPDGALFGIRLPVLPVDRSQE